MYADDTQLYIDLPATRQWMLPQIVSDLSMRRDVKAWMTQHKFTLNDDKTKAAAIRHRRHVPATTHRHQYRHSRIATQASRRGE